MQMLQSKHGGKQRLIGIVCAALGIFVHKCAERSGRYDFFARPFSLRKQGQTISLSSYCKTLESLLSAECFFLSAAQLLSLGVIQEEWREACVNV